jgi:hypothetical protein
MLRIATAMLRILRIATAKVAWVGRTASMLFGLALVMALAISAPPAAAQSGVKATAAGGYHSLTLRDDGSVVA